MATNNALMVNVKSSWPRVQSGDVDPDESVLCDWGQLTNDAQINEIKIVLGMFQNRVVAVYELDSVNPWERLPNGRVRFHGIPSQKYAYLIGAPNPGWQFDRQHVARAVQRVPLDLFTDGAPVEQPEPNVQRAVVGGYVLEVKDGAAVLILPPDGSATVRAT